MQRVFAFGDQHLRTGELKTLDYHIDAYGLNQLTGMESRLIQQQCIYYDRRGEDGIRQCTSFRERRCSKAQGMYIDECVLAAVTYKEAVYLYLHRQIRLPFVGAIEHHRRMMKRREVDPSQIDVIVRFIVRYGYSFVDDFLCCRLYFNTGVTEHFAVRQILGISCLYFLIEDIIINLAYVLT